MDYLLDSDAIIDFLKGEEPGLSLLKAIARKNLKISVISWSEVVYGIKKQANYLKKIRQFKDFLAEFKIDIKAVDILTVDKFTELKIELEKKGQKLADFDLLIAGTALVNNLVLVTRNKKHFKRITGLKLAD